MQKVSLEQLKMLLPEKNAVVSESDDDIAKGLSFKKLCNEYYDIKKAYDGDVQLTYDVFKGVLDQYAPPIVLAGQGSSRAVFACEGGKCVKVAINNAGIAQNAYEYKHTAKHWWKHEYQCFAHTYDKSRGNELLLSECCSPAKSYKQLFSSLNIDDVEQLALAFVAITELKGDTAKEISDKLREVKSAHGITKIKNYLFNAKTTDAISKWFDAIKTGSAGETWPMIIRELIRFWNKYGTDELLPSDLTSLENWGYAIRYGGIAPVIIDAGFSKSVADTYYS